MKDTNKNHESNDGFRVALEIYREKLSFRSLYLNRKFENYSRQWNISMKAIKRPGNELELSISRWYNKTGVSYQFLSNSTALKPSSPYVRTHFSYIHTDLFWSRFKCHSLVINSTLQYFLLKILISSDITVLPSFFSLFLDLSQILGSRLNDWCR